jgi:hypothetical protein
LNARRGMMNGVALPERMSKRKIVGGWLKLENW